MAWEAPGGIVCNLGTLCLTRKAALGIALHAVHSSPLPMPASPGGAPLPLGRSEELELESFSSPAVLKRPTGKGNPLLALWGISNPKFPWLCKGNLLYCSSGVSRPTEWEQQGTRILGTNSLLAPGLARAHPAALCSILTPKYAASLLCLVFGSGFAGPSWALS